MILLFYQLLTSPIKLVNVNASNLTEWLQGLLLLSPNMKDFRSILGFYDLWHFVLYVPAGHKTILQNVIKGHVKQTLVWDRWLLKRPYASFKPRLVLVGSGPDFPFNSSVSQRFTSVESLLLCFRAFSALQLVLLEKNTYIWPLRCSSGLTFTKDDERTKNESSWPSVVRTHTIEHFLMFTCIKISLKSHLNLHWK